MTSKVWAMGLVVLAASAFALVVCGAGAACGADRRIDRDVSVGAALQLFATTSMGIFLGTIARSMPQFGLLLMLVLLPLQMLSGGTSPRESMPEVIQYLMLAAPNTHFVMLAQAILYRGAGFRRSVAAIRQNRRDRRNPVRPVARALPPHHQHHGMSMKSGCGKVG